MIFTRRQFFGGAAALLATTAIVCVPVALIPVKLALRGPIFDALADAMKMTTEQRDSVLARRAREGWMEEPPRHMAEYIRRQTRDGRPILAAWPI